MTIEKITEDLTKLTTDCIEEIESDYSEEELKNWTKRQIIDYLIEYLSYERDS